MNNKGFTLIELIVVMAIIAVMVLLAAPRFLGYTKDANVTAMQQDTKVLTDAAEMYHVDAGDWPKGSKLTDINIPGIGGELYSIDETKLSDSIKSISGDYDDYAIVTTGQYKGSIVHLEGIEDKDGNTSNSHMAINRGIYTEEEVDNLITEGYIPIATADELDSLRDSTEQTFGQGTKWENRYTSGLDKKYIQVMDIDLSGISNWEPISIFTGGFDGAGYSISNLKAEWGNRVGLFGSVSEGIIKNAHLKDVVVRGISDVGGLIGHSSNSFIGGSSVSGVVDATKHRVGGLVGRNHSSTIEYSVASVDVVGNTNIGGLVGSNTDHALINNSYTTGSVSGVNRVGGLTGLNYVSSSITNSYATGNTVGSVDIGGLVGRNGGGNVADSGWANDICLVGIGSSKKLERAKVDGVSENVVGQPKSKINSILSKLIK